MRGGGLSYLERQMRQRRAGTALRGIKSAIESGESSLVEQTTRRAAGVLGGRQVASRLATIVTGRLSGALSHDQASAEFTTLAGVLRFGRISVTSWRVWENLSQATGCFRASAAFAELAQSAQEARPIRHDQDRVDTFLIALEKRSLAEAAQVWHTRAPTPETAAFWDDAGHLLWLWSRGEAGAPNWSDEQSWVDAVGGRRVVVWGPAPSTGRPQLSADDLAGRIIAPGVLRWPAEDPLGGRCDLAWANSASTKAFLSEGIDRDWDDFRWVSFRTERWRELAINNGRTSRHHKRLLPMPWDKTNMIPLAVWDLLAVPEVRVEVGGTTFFASAKAYTDNDQRAKGDDGARTDERGSTGGVLERCLSFSNHAVVAHHNLMSLLHGADAVQFDQEGSAVLGLSKDAYLNELDRLYGVDLV